MKLAEFHRRRYAGRMSAPKRNSYIVSRLKEEWKGKRTTGVATFSSVIYLFYPCLFGRRVSRFTRKFFSMFFHRPENNCWIERRFLEKSSFIYYHLHQYFTLTEIKVSKLQFRRYINITVYIIIYLRKKRYTLEWYLQISGKYKFSLC